MKKIISLCLSLVMLMSAVFCVDFSAFATEFEVSNRAQWLSKLVEIYDMTVESENYPDNYFSDLTEESEYYRDILVAVEFGLVNVEAGNPINPEGEITREFAAQTLNFCFGCVLEIEDEEHYEYTFSDYKECIYPQDDQVAINRGWFEIDEKGCFNPDQIVTATEISFMLDDAIDTKKSDEIDNSYDSNYHFADYVIEIPESTTLSIDQDYVVEILDCPKTIEVGDTFVVYYNGIPIVRIADNIETIDNITRIVTSEADEDSAIIDIDMENSSTVDVSQFEPVEGLDIKENNKSSTYMMKTRSVVISDEEITLEGKVDVKGVSVGLSVKISNIAIDTRIDTKNDEYMAVVSYDAQVKTTVSVDAKDVQIPIGSVPVLGIGSVALSLNLNLKGNAYISQKFKSAVGFAFSKKDGTRNIVSFVKEEFTLNLQVSGSVGLKLGAKVSVLVLKVEIYGDIGFKANVTNTYHGNGMPRMCTTIEAYLYLDFGYSFSVGISFIKYQKSDTVNIFSIKNSPVRLYIHLEDGCQVDKCTNGMEFNYLTPQDSSVVSVNTEYFENLSKEKQFLLTYQIAADDLKYKSINNEIIITGYAGYEGEYNFVAIPSEIDGKKVTMIEKNAFNNCNFSSIIIPETVESIGDYAFYGCISLEKIVILNDNMIIGNHAFDWDLNDSNQSVGDVPIYCNYNSTAYDFCAKNEGFHYESLKWDGENIWGVASSNNIYHIYTGQELAYMSQIVSNGYDLSGFTIKLESDIDLGNYDWYPIGTYSKPYRGSFEGSGKSINNFKPKILGLNGGQIANSTGIFGYVEANEDLIFSNVSINQNKVAGRDSSWKGYYLGGLIGTIEVNKNVLLTNVVSNCTNSNDTNWSFNPVYQGGIVGYIRSTGNATVNLSNCSNKGAISACSYDGGSASGGLVGVADLGEESNLIFYQCSNTGKIWSSESVAYAYSYSGGIIAKGNGGNYSFNECAVDGSIYAKANGAIVGIGGLVSEFAPNTLKVKNCEIFAHIYGTQNQSAGIIGSLDTKNLDYNNSYIKNSYISSVIKGSEKGAFVRCSTDGSDFVLPIENSYFDSGKTSLKWLVYSTSQGGFFYSSDSVNIGDWCKNSGIETSDNLRNDMSLYDNWDFDSIWKYDDSGYPILRCFDEVFPCYEHNYSTVVESPTCTSQGYTTYTCKKCQYTYTDNYTSALGHKFSYTKTVSPTCTAQGYDVYTCSVCNNTEKRNTVSSTGHNYEVTSNTATCTEAGLRTEICSNCGDVQETEIAALGHSYIKTYIRANCTENGYTINTCSRCNDTYYDGIIEATGHDYGDCIGDDYLNTIYGEDGKFVESPNGPGSNGKYICVSSCIGTTISLNAVVCVMPQQIRVDVNNINDITKYKFWLKKRANFLSGRTCDGMFSYDINTGRAPEQSAIPYTDKDGNLINMKYVDYLTENGWICGKYSYSNGILTDENGAIVTDTFTQTRPHIVYTKEYAAENGILNSDGTVNVTTEICREISFSAGVDGVYFIAEAYQPTNITGKYVDTFGYDSSKNPPAGVYKVNVCFYNSSLCGTGEFNIKIYDKDESQKEIEENEYNLTCIDCGENHTEICDRSAIVAALNRVSDYSPDDYSKESLATLQGLCDKYEFMSDSYASQEQIDSATREILTAITELVPYLNLNISSPNGAFTVTYNGETNSRNGNSLLFGTNVTVTATANEGYEFVGWYDTVNNLYFSKNAEYSFNLTTNTSLKAVFVKEQSATLTFTTYSNWVQSTVTKTIDEWNDVKSIDDLLPEVPYKYGYSNGRWVYDNAEVLGKLQTGENVTLIPEYDEDDTSLPTPPSPDGDTPVLDLYYKLDADANVGSFVMAAGIPESCQLESVGVLFYYKNADEFDPTKFELLINNKMLAGRFNTDKIEDIYIVNMNNMSADKNWAARGYVTYYDAEGNLKTVYSNQVNIVNREQV